MADVVFGSKKQTGFLVCHPEVYKKIVDNSDNYVVHPLATLVDAGDHSIRFALLPMHSSITREFNAGL